MSKSRGNFITAREAVEKFGYRLLRFFFISNHYRTTLDFNEDVLIQARGALDRLDEFVSKIDVNMEDNAEELKAEVMKNLDNDFDTPKAMATIFNFIRNNQDKAGKNTYAFFQELNSVFDF